MTLRLFFRICFSFLLIFNSEKSHAQTFLLKGLNGGNETISIIVDNPSGKISVIGKKKCFNIFNINGLDEKIEVLNDYFLKISVIERVGVGVDSRRTYLFTSINQVLHESLAFQNRYEETITNTYTGHKDSSALNQHQLETVDYKILDKGKFGISIKFHEEKTNQNSRVDNYSFNTNVNLKFDDKKGLFYSNKKKLNGQYMIRKPNNASTKKILGSSYFSTIIRGTTYYYIDDEEVWLEEGNSNNLISHSSTCNKI